MFYRRCIGLNLSRSTLENYRKHLTDYLLFLSQTMDIETIAETTENTILQYLKSLKGRGLSPVTVLDRFIVLRVFYSFLVEWGYLESNPMEHLKKPKVPKRHARTFTTSEIMAILKSYDKTTFLGYRNYTIMCVLFSTGIRKTELLKLSVLDIHLQECFLVVLHGKGDKTREIPIGLSLRRILKKYLRDREEVLQEHSSFTSQFLVTFSGKPLTASGLDTVFKRLKESMKGLGIPERRLSAHTWRHTFAKTFLLNGGDLFTLQQILGHEDVSTTRIYVEYTNKEMKVQNDKYNPLDNHQWQYL